MKEENVNEDDSTKVAAALIMKEESKLMPCLEAKVDCKKKDIIPGELRTTVPSPRKTFMFYRLVPALARYWIIQQLASLKPLWSCGQYPRLIKIDL
jgi:hypothetical protein